MLDIGTGSGVLAVAAARAGARHVYAVEASDIAEVAERVFAANGVQDRVTLIPGWSRQIELPEPADLLVAEIIGNEPFEEEILETTLDARRRLLKPEARLIPNALTLLARPLLVPEAEARQRAIGRDAVERWRRLYDIEFQPLLDAAPAGPGALHPPRARWRPGGRPSGPPVVLAAVDLAAFEDASVAAPPTSPSTQRATVNAVAVTFRADLHGAVAHTLDPVDVAGLELGDVGLGAPGPGSGRPRERAARALQPPDPPERRTGSPARSSSCALSRGRTCCFTRLG